MKPAKEFQSRVADKNDLPVISLCIVLVISKAGREILEDIEISEPEEGKHRSQEDKKS